MDIESRIKLMCSTFDNLTEEDCVGITLASRSLSLEECYDYLLIDKSELSPAEIKFAERIYRRGRAIGVKDAGDKLFQHMGNRNGGQTALEYLKKMSGDFSAEVVASSGKGFQFNVTIPEV